jgi:small subunit ribosomal protein S20
MANIKQQKKRIGVAARQRMENLRYKSAAKTLLKSLQLQVDTGDKASAEKTHKELVSLLDRAAAKRSLHRNTVSRKKSRAARILVSEPTKTAEVVRRAKKKPVRKAKPQADAGAAATKAAKAKAAPKKAAEKAPVEENTAEATATEETATEAPAEATPAEEATSEEAPAE